MIISSFFPGRIRLRAEVLKDKDISDALIGVVEHHESIKRIEHNIKTGSVLIEYIPEKLPVEKLNFIKDELLSLNRLAETYTEKTKPCILEQIENIEKKLFQSD